MTDESSAASEPLAQHPPPGLLRRVALPTLVIALIVGAIWFIEHERGASNSAGERYGPVSLPAGLRPADVKVRAEPGALAPDFLLERLDAGELRLSDLRGQPVVLNFWATWCAPCRKEMPQFVNAYSRFQDDGLVVVAVNLQEGSSLVRPFANDYGIRFPIAIDRDGEVGDEYRILGLPTTVFIDRQGMVRSVFIGPLLQDNPDKDVQGAIDQTELDRRIAEIMASQPTSPAAQSPGDGQSGSNGSR